MFCFLFFFLLTLTFKLLKKVEVPQLSPFASSFFPREFESVRTNLLLDTDEDNIMEVEKGGGKEREGIVCERFFIH